MEFDDRGREIPDSTPIVLPVGFNRPPTIAEQVAQLVRVHMSNIAQKQGFETFEEADDFEIEDDYDPRSPHELERNQEMEPRFTQKGLEREFREFLKTKAAESQAGRGVNGDPPGGTPGGVPGGDQGKPASGQSPAGGSRGVPAG